MFVQPHSQMATNIFGNLIFTLEKRVALGANKDNVIRRMNHHSPEMRALFASRALSGKAHHFHGYAVVTKVVPGTTTRRIFVSPVVPMVLPISIIHAASSTPVDVAG